MGELKVEGSIRELWKLYVRLSLPLETSYCSSGEKLGWAELQSDGWFWDRSMLLPGGNRTTAGGAGEKYENISNIRLTAKASFDPH